MAAIGRRVLVQGFALAGVLVVEADDADQVRRAWDSLPADVAVAVLTPAAAAALGEEALARGPALAVVMPS